MGKISTLRNFINFLLHFIGEEDTKNSLWKNCRHIRTVHDNWDILDSWKILSVDRLLLVQWHCPIVFVCSFSQLIKASTRPKTHLPCTILFICVYNFSVTYLLFILKIEPYFYSCFHDIPTDSIAIWFKQQFFLFNFDR